jgi:Mce-associated membrane protein
MDGQSPDVDGDLMSTLTEDGSRAQQDPVGGDVTAGARGEPTSIRRLLTALVVLLAAAVVATAILTGYFAAQHSDDDAVTTGSQQALAAATTEIVTATSYSYRTFPANEAAALADVTPAFRVDYKKVLAEAQSTVATYKAVVQSSVQRSAVQRYGATNAVIMVFLDQSSTETVRTGALTQGYRLLVTMQKVGSHWLIAAIAPV